MAIISRALIGVPESGTQRQALEHFFWGKERLKPSDCTAPLMGKKDW